MTVKTRTVKMVNYGQLLLTRERGREIALDLPDGPVRLRLDFTGVDVASPSFLDEVIKGAVARRASRIEFVGISEPTRKNVDRLIAHRAENQGLVTA